MCKRMLLSAWWRHFWKYGGRWFPEPLSPPHPHPLSCLRRSDSSCVRCSFLLRYLSAHARHLAFMAWQYMWWPNVDHDIECTVKSSVRCQEEAKNPAKKTGTWTWSNGLWKRLHIDFVGPFMGKMFLVVVDTFLNFWMWCQWIMQRVQQLSKRCDTFLNFGAARTHHNG